MAGNQFFRTTTSDKTFNEVLDLIEEWQQKGRNGHCMPVIHSGQLLEALEELADTRRRESCSWCKGTGKISDGYEDFDCQHCSPLREF